MNERKIRNQKGAAVTGLVLALFFFIMLCGFFAFDSSRIQMAQRELTATCDSAALAGTAMLTSYDTSNDDANLDKLQAAQTNACAYARNMFQAGNLLGQPLTNCNIVGTYAAVGVTGAPGSTNVMISLADPTNNYQGVSPGYPSCANGKAIMVYACYTYTPVFLSIVGVGTVGLNAFSGGGLPQVDAVLVFDFSGSMDDGTNVFLIRRTWDSNINSSQLTSGAASYMANDCTYTTGGANQLIMGSTPKEGSINYIDIPPTQSLHSLSQFMQWNYASNPNGMQMNVLPPENLEASNTTDSTLYPNCFQFDATLRVNTLPFSSNIPGALKQGNMPAQTAGNTWNTDYGTPPGNCTLAPPYGYGYPYLQTGAYSNSGVSAGMLYKSGGPWFGTVGGADCNMAYDSFYDAGFAGVASYTASDYTKVNVQRYFTDMVVNINDPGAWPYTQPLQMASNAMFSNFTVTFPAQEPDPNLANNSFTFEDLGVLVEAARGNLDNANNAQGALLDRNEYVTINGDEGVTTLYQKSALSLAHVKSGYQEAYQRLAMLFSQPIATAVDGADGGFFQKINSLCDCRFGFVGFSNANTVTVGSSPNSTTIGSQHNSTDIAGGDSYFTSVNYYGQGDTTLNYWWNGLANTEGAENNAAIAGGQGTGFRQPRRPLKFVDTQIVSVEGVDGCRVSSTVISGISASWNNPSADANGLENGNPVDQTMTYEAMNTARYMFLDGDYNLTSTSSSRPAAAHAIVFFSDGVPNGGLGSTDATGALSVAAACQTDGLSVYTIGMDTTNNNILQADQKSFMGMSSTGLAGAASNGSQFFQCTTSQTVKYAFDAVARRLSQSQR